jgi:hypothetical protein
MPSIHDGLVPHFCLLEFCVNFRHLVVHYDSSLKIYGAAADGALTR